MWISELSTKTGVPRDTIKHYIRVGLLPRGEVESARRAEYHDAHVRRLIMIRALIDVADMRLDQVQKLLDVIDEAGGDVTRAIALAHYQLSNPISEQGTPTAAARELADRVIDRTGWITGPNSPHRKALAITLTSVLAADPSVPIEEHEETALRWAKLMSEGGRGEAEAVNANDPHEAVWQVLILTALYEPVLSVLRRLAQENWTMRAMEPPAPVAAGS